MEDTNWLAMVVGAFVPMVVGSLWYSKLLFEKPWMESNGMTEEDIRSGNMPLIFGLAILMALVVAYYLQMLIGYHPEEERTFVHSAFHGAMSALMIAVPVMVSRSLFERKSLNNILINTSYWVVTFALMGGVMSLLF